MSNEHKSFRMSSGKPSGFDDITKKEWWHYRKLTKKEYGNAAIVCMLAGFLVPILFLVGVIAGIIWLYQTFAERKKHL